MEVLRMCAFGDGIPCDKHCQFYNTCTRSVKNKKGEKKNETSCERKTR